MSEGAEDQDAGWKATDGESEVFRTRLNSPSNVIAKEDTGESGKGESGVWET